MSDINPRCLEFIGSKVQELIQNGVSVHLTKGNCVNDKYSGNFHADSKTIRVAMGNGDHSVYTFLHEYAHYVQFRDKRELWDKLHEGGTVKYSDWLYRSKNLTKEEIEQAFRNIVALEHDAETMAISMISTHNLPLAIAQLSRTASCNLIYYAYTRIHRSWGKGHFSVCDAEVERQLPDVIQPLDFYTDMKNAKSIFKKSGIKIGKHTRYY